MFLINCICNEDVYFGQTDSFPHCNIVDECLYFCIMLTHVTSVMTHLLKAYTNRRLNNNSRNTFTRNKNFINWTFAHKHRPELLLPDFCHYTVFAVSKEQASGPCPKIFALEVRQETTNTWPWQTAGEFNVALLNQDTLSCNSKWKRETIIYERTDDTDILVNF